MTGKETDGSGTTGPNTNRGASDNAAPDGATENGLDKGGAHYTEDGFPLTDEAFKETLAIAQAGVSADALRAREVLAHLCDERLRHKAHYWAKRRGKEDLEDTLYGVAKDIFVEAVIPAFAPKEGECTPKKLCAFANRMVDRRLWNWLNRDYRTQPPVVPDEEGGPGPGIKPRQEVPLPEGYVTPLGDLATRGIENPILRAKWLVLSVLRYGLTKSRTEWLDIAQALCVADDELCIYLMEEWPTLWALYWLDQFGTPPGDVPEDWIGVAHLFLRRPSSSGKVLPFPPPTTSAHDLTKYSERLSRMYRRLTNSLGDFVDDDLLGE